MKRSDANTKIPLGYQLPLVNIGIVTISPHNADGCHDGLMYICEGIIMYTNLYCCGCYKEVFK